MYLLYKRPETQLATKHEEENLVQKILQKLMKQGYNHVSLADVGSKI
jgi:hypothetical protein